MSNSGIAPEAPLRSLARVSNRLLANPAIHIIAGITILLLDLLTGPFLSFPILFVIPVVLSAWFCNARLAYGLAVFLPVGRFLIAVFRDTTAAAISVNGTNALIRVGVLSLLALLVARTARQGREIKVLRGLLSICMFCKRVRTEDGGWERFETYIANHSEADFSHGLCPDCAKTQTQGSLR